MNCFSCAQPYNEFQHCPRLLIQCGHTLCEACITLNLSNKTITCPECHASNYADSVNSMPKNIALISVARPTTRTTNNAKEQSANKQSPHKNSDLSKKIISSPNSNGGINLKQNQNTLQSNPSQSSAQVTRTSEDRSEIICMKHFKKFEVYFLILAYLIMCTENGRKAYCMNEKCLLCINCILEDGTRHKNHALEPLTTAESTERTNVEIESKKLHAHSAKIAELINRLLDSRNRITLNASESSKAISAFIGDLHRAVDSLETDLQSRLSLHSESEQATLTNSINSLQQQLKSANEKYQHITHFNSANSTLSFLSCMNQFKTIDAFIIDDRVLKQSTTPSLRVFEFDSAKELNKLVESINIISNLNNNKQNQSKSSTNYNLSNAVNIANKASPMIVATEMLQRLTTAPSARSSKTQSQVMAQTTAIVTTIPATSVSSSYSLQKQLKGQTSHRKQISQISKVILPKEKEKEKAKERFSSMNLKCNQVLTQTAKQVSTQKQAQFTEMQKVVALAIATATATATSTLGTTKTTQRSNTENFEETIDETPQPINNLPAPSIKSAGITKPHLNNYQELRTQLKERLNSDNNAQQQQNEEPIKIHSSLFQQQPSSTALTTGNPKKQSQHQQIKTQRSPVSMISLSNFPSVAVSPSNSKQRLNQTQSSCKQVLRKSFNAPLIHSTTFKLEHSNSHEILAKSGRRNSNQETYSQTFHSLSPQLKDPSDSIQQLPPTSNPVSPSVSTLQLFLYNSNSQSQPHQSLQSQSIAQQQKSQYQNSQKIASQYYQYSVSDQNQFINRLGSNGNYSNSNNINGPSFIGSDFSVDQSEIQPLQSAIPSQGVIEMTTLLQSQHSLSKREKIPSLMSNNNTNQPRINAKDLESAAESIYIIGGNLESTMNSIDRFDSSNGSTIVFDSVQQNRSKFTAIYRQSTHSILLIGGKLDGNRVSTIEEYSLNNRTSSQHSIRLTSPRSGFGAVYNNDKLTVIGGNDGTQILDSIEIYDLNSFLGNPIQLSRMNDRRDELAVAVGKNGFIYAIGGFGGASNACLNSVERFNPQHNSWERVASLNQTRRALAAVSLVDGIYAIGGFDGNQYLNSVERYDEILNCWFMVSRMNSPRCTVSAVASLDGKAIYVFGGFDGNALASVERYCSVKGVWEKLRDMPSKRLMHCAVAVPSCIFNL